MLQSDRSGANDPRAGTVVDAWTSLALWLRAGRSQRGLTLEDVARVTKIQTRTLERLESGKRAGLPADVFVRGFVRSFAKCVGLDDGEALRRYGACCNGAPAAVTDEPSARTRAMLEAMSELAPEAAAAQRVAATPAPAPAPAPSIEPSLASGSLQDLPRSEPVRRRFPTIEPAVGDTPRPIYIDRELVEPAVVAPVVAPVALEPSVAEQANAAAELTDGAAPAKRKRGRRGGKGRNKRKTLANGTPPEASPVVAANEALANEIAATVDAATIDAAAIDAALGAEATAESAPEIEAAPSIDAVAPPASIDAAADASTDSTEATWRPTMPPAATQSAPPPWGRPRRATTAPTRAVPTLVIDDADPERAEEVLEERAAAKAVLTTAQRRSLLPPILLDREDRSARQGGLTLAVILLLIAATITLSYLMRRPSSSGDGVTQRPAATDVIG